MQILTCSDPFFIPIQETEQSTLNSVAVLDDTAHKKDTVLKVLNILYEKLEACEVIWKHKVKAFLSYISDDFIPFQQYNF